MASRGTLAAMSKGSSCSPASWSSMCCQYLMATEKADRGQGELNLKPRHGVRVPMKHVLVPSMIFLSGSFMAVAWLGHLRIKEYGFWIALAMSWSIVLPEYVLNVAA